MRQAAEGLSCYDFDILGAVYRSELLGGDSLYLSKFRRILREGEHRYQDGLIKRSLQRLVDRGFLERIHQEEREYGQRGRSRVYYMLTDSGREIWQTWIQQILGIKPEGWVAVDLVILNHTAS
jgi:DNA-binding PadR family transcriptional regulator